MKKKKKKTTLLTITYFLVFVWSEESSEYSGLFFFISDTLFLEYEQRREDRFITFKKDMEIRHK